MFVGFPVRLSFKCRSGKVQGPEFEIMPQFTCVRCGWCCKHIMVRRKIFAVSRQDREWMKARGLFFVKDQLIIPSVCPHLGAEDIGGEHEEKYVCKCMIQDRKPKVCSEGRCVKEKYPGIDRND